MTPEPPAETALPPVPLTVEGSSVLHQMMRFRRAVWRALSADARYQIAEEAIDALAAMEQPDEGRQSGAYSMLGHFRRSFEELEQAQRAVAQLRLSDYLEPATSYLSVVELGLYESTSDTYAALARRGIKPNSDE